MRIIIPQKSWPMKWGDSRLLLLLFSDAFRVQSIPIGMRAYV